MDRRESDGFSPTTWTTNVLPPVELTMEQRDKYRVLATQLLSNTLRDYDIYSADPKHRRMSRRRWKPVKTRDHITVYKERYPTPTPLVGASSRTSRATGMDVTRGRISSCSIFREIPAGLGSRHSKVDVYVKGYVEAHGKLLDSVALTAASTGFMSSWNAVECANLKKLMWCFRQQPNWTSGRRRGSQRVRRSSQRSHGSSSISCSPNVDIHDNVHTVTRSPQDLTCGTCTKRLNKVVSGAISCGLCSGTTCSRCRVSRTLKEVNNKLWLRQEDVLICKRCVLRVDHLAAVDVARAEVDSGWFSTESVPVPISTPECKASFTSTGVTTDTGASVTTLPTEEELTRSVLSPTADAPMDSFRGKMIHEDVTEHSEGDEVALSDRERREQIWSQMVGLRMVAESIYKLTLETSESLNAAPQRSR
uniref:FYVE-type domain-containing protein n=1 Tax=Phytophthora fragariae TaxID=53985 RepID=A0A6A3DR50_9STRA|nr:hypothetical protein PF009_g27435 [Phytophthora fragariae]